MSTETNISLLLHNTLLAVCMVIVILHPHAAEAVTGLLHKDVGPLHAASSSLTSQGELKSHPAHTQSWEGTLQRGQGAPLALYSPHTFQHLPRDQSSCHSSCSQGKKAGPVWLCSPEKPLQGAVRWCWGQGWQEECGQVLSNGPALRCACVLPEPQGFPDSKLDFISQDLTNLKFKEKAQGD